MIDPTEFQTVDTWENELRDAIKEAALPGLENFAIETFSSQVNLETDQLNRAVPHLLIGFVSGDHSNGYVRGDVLNFAAVAIVPGALADVRRQTAIRALWMVRAWMDDPAEPTVYQPIRTSVNQYNPVCVATLELKRVG